MSNSASREMAEMIVSISQKRFVNTGSLFECNSNTIRLVNTNLGVAFLLNEKLMFYIPGSPTVADYYPVSHAFYLNSIQSAEITAWYSDVRFGGTEIIVFRFTRCTNPDGEYDQLRRFSNLLKLPPVIVAQD
jgi:hypothetical protein